MCNNSNKPHSIQLSDDHRTYILNAIMEQWEKANPPPAGTSFEYFIKETLRALLEVPARATTQQLALKQLVKRTQDAQKLRKTLPHTLKDLVSIAETDSFRLAVILDDGSKNVTYFFRLPLAMAKDLKIPYLQVNKYVGRQNEEMPSYLEDDPSVDNRKIMQCVSLANKHPYNTLTIHRDFKPHIEYRKTQRALNLWEKEKSSFRNEIQGYLNQFNTTGQIRDGWPEMEQYLPAHIADPAKVIKLPALTRSRLNERLGLK